MAVKQTLLFLLIKLRLILQNKDTFRIYFIDGELSVNLL